MINEGFFANISLPTRVPKRKQKWPFGHLSCQKKAGDNQPRVGTKGEESEWTEKLRQQRRWALCDTYVPKENVGRVTTDNSEEIDSLSLNVDDTDNYLGY